MGIVVWPSWSDCEGGNKHDHSCLSLMEYWQVKTFYYTVQGQCIIVMEKCC